MQYVKLVDRMIGYPCPSMPRVTCIVLFVCGEDTVPETSVDEERKKKNEEKKKRRGKKEDILEMEGVEHN